MTSRICGFFGLLVIFFPAVWFAQSPGLRSVVMVTDDLDSLTRAFVKQGFTVQPGIRDPVGILEDAIIFPNASSVLLQHPGIGEQWRQDALETYGRPFVSELRFATHDPDSLRTIVEAAGIGVVLIDSMLPSRGFAIDSTSPVVILFTNDTVQHPFVPHPQGYYRIDWVILGASTDVEERLRRLFEAIGFLKRHRGCCDFWRAGSSKDFTFFRFETPQAPWRGEPMWLSVGKNALYFAWH